MGGPCFPCCASGALPRRVPRFRRSSSLLSSPTYDRSSDRPRDSRVLAFGRRGSCYRLEVSHPASRIAASPVHRVPSPGDACPRPALVRFLPIENPFYYIEGASACSSAPRLARPNAKRSARPEAGLHHPDCVRHQIFPRRRAARTSSTLRRPRKRAPVGRMFATGPMP